MALAVGSAHSATITENFDSSLGSTPPTGWTFAGSGTYNTGTGETGNGGSIESSVSTGRIPGAYIINSGSQAYDLRESITVNFDVKVSETGNYESAAVMFGNIAEGTTGTADELLSMSFGRNNFGNDDPEIVNGANTILTPGENQQKVIFGTWHSGTYTWTPTSGTTGDLSFTLTGTQNGNVVMSVTGFTFGDEAGYFAFGDLDSDGVTYDNIEITGTVVPEPGSLALLGLGGLMMITRRRNG